MPAMPDNPLLPSDYFGLDPKRQHEARLAAYSSVGRTPEEFELAHGFFCDVCLGRRPGGPCPDGFFYRDLIPGGPPEFHRRVVREIGRHPKVMVQWPRAACKSTVVTKSLPIWLALTRKIEVLIVTIAEAKVSEIMDDISFQLRNNPVIKSEWGDVHARRHEGLWSHRNITLRNRSKISVAAWKSSSLVGKRPQLVIVDDIEHHNKANRDPDATRDKLDDWFYHVIHPMIEKGSSILWISTLSRRDFYSYHVANGLFDADDPRWTFWHRTTLAAEWPDPETGERRLLWPEKWSLEYLDAKRRELGDAAYSAQFLNKPGAEDVALFRLDDRYHLYSVSHPTPAERRRARVNRALESGVIVGGAPKLEPHDFVDRPHPSLDPDPLSSDIVVRWNEPDGGDNPVEQSMPASKLFGSMFRMATLDFASTTHARSDYSGCMIHGFDARNRQWVLDLALGRWSEENLLQRAYDMCSRWRVHLCTVEDVGRQSALRERAGTLMRQMAQGGGHAYSVGGTKYRSMDKGLRIAGMEWRFSANCLLLPKERRGDPSWRQLFEQIRLFTPDLSLLENDDAIDMLSMVQFAEGRGVGQVLREKLEPTPEERVATGRRVDEHGFDWGLAARPSPSLVDAVRRNAARPGAKRRAGKWKRA